MTCCNDLLHDLLQCGNHGIKWGQARGSTWAQLLLVAGWESPLVSGYYAAYWSQRFAAASNGTESTNNVTQVPPSHLEAQRCSPRAHCSTTAAPQLHAPVTPAWIHAALVQGPALPRLVMVRHPRLLGNPVRSSLYRFHAVEW